MKKAKTQIKVLDWLNTGIFPANIMFSVGFTYAEINKMLTKKKAWDWKLGISKDEQLFADSTWLAIKRTIYRKSTNENEVELFYIIIKKPFGFADYDYCKLAHEVLHICQFMLPEILNRDREFECEAYLHTHIMQQCLKSIRGSKKT